MDAKSERKISWQVRTNKGSTVAEDEKLNVLQHAVNWSLLCMGLHSCRFVRVSMLMSIEKNHFQRLRGCLIEPWFMPGCRFSDEFRFLLNRVVRVPQYPEEKLGPRCVLGKLKAGECNVMTAERSPGKHYILYRRCWVCDFVAYHVFESHELAGKPPQSNTFLRCQWQLSAG